MLDRMEGAVGFTYQARQPVILALCIKVAVQKSEEIFCIKGQKCFKHLPYTYPTGEGCQIEFNQLADILIP